MADDRTVLIKMVWRELVSVKLHFNAEKLPQDEDFLKPNFMAAERFVGLSQGVRNPPLSRCLITMRLGENPS